MNEELLKAIHKKFFSDKDYETFKTDFTGSPELRRAVHGRYLADKSSYNQFEIDLGLKQPPVSADPDDDFSEGLKKVPVVGGLLNAGYKAIKRGIGQGASLEEGMNALVEGKGLSADEIQAVALIAQKTKADTESDNSLSAKFSRGEDLSVPELFGFAAETVLQSGAMMIRGLFDSFTSTKTAAIVGGASGTGAAAASPLFGIGAIPGGIAGAMGSVSGMTEASGILFGDIIQTLSDKGLPINSKNVGDLLADDDWMEEVRKKAAAKGIVVGGVDAITGGISAKIGTKAIKKIGEGALTGAAKRKVIAGAAARGVVTEMSGGAGGERLGQVAAGEPYDPRAVAAEALGEIFGVVNVFTPYLSKRAIVEAREAQNKADVAGVPVTSAEKELAAKPLSIGPLVDAYKANDIKLGITALSDLAVLHTPEDFNGMLDILSKSEGGISAEDMAILSDKFTEAQEIANGFTTPELLADPAKRSRLVEKRLTARYITTEKEKIAAEQAKADPVLKPQFQAQIDELDAQLAEIENTMTAVANSPSIPVVDDAEVYKADLAKMDEEDAAEVSRMRELETELLAMGTQIQDDINTGYYGDAGGRYASWFDERGIGEEANQAEKDKSASVLIKGLIGASYNDEKLVKPVSVPKEAVLRMGQGDETKGREFFKRAREIATELRDLKSRRNPNEMKRRSLIRAERQGRIDKLTETVGDEEYTAFINRGIITPERAKVINEKKNTPDKMSARERQMFAAGLPESDVVEIEEYGAFKETQKVSTERVNEIADKKLMGETLSPREEEMAQAAAPQVESVIAQKEEAQRTISVGDIVVKYDKEGNSTGEKYKVKNIITYERGSWKNSDGSMVTDGKKQKQLDNRRRGERKESTVIEYQSLNEEGVATGITYPMGLHDMNHLGERNQVSYRKEGLSPQTKTEQNAIFEQKTNALLLRNQQVGLQEVGEGNTVAEQAKKEGQAEGQGQTQETRGQEEKVAGVTLDEIAEEVGVKATNFRDLVRINRELFGQNVIKSAASAVVMDRMIGRMARRAGITKAQMYGRLEFRKSTAEKLPADAVLQKALKESKDIQLVKDKDGNLLAPNGQPSNLNETQWRLVRTEAFKDWFGDWENDPKNASKVVDANGEPLVVYHGTNAKFNEFQHGRSVGSGDSELYFGKGFYFTNDQKTADSYSGYKDKTIPSFLNIRNPIVSTEKMHSSPWGEKSFKRDNLLKGSDREVQAQLKARGHDGVTHFSGQSGYSDKYGDHEIDYDEYVVFEPNQIKLADGTNTTFNAGTGDIRFQYDDIPDYIYDYHSLRDELESEMVNEALNYKKGDKQSWRKLPTERVKKIWNDYVKTGFVRDEAGMKNIVEIIIENSTKLQLNTAFMGHDTYDAIADYAARNNLTKTQIKKLKKVFEETDFAEDKNGQPILSDYGTPKLLKIVGKLLAARTPEEQLLLVDQALNVVHQRSDLAELFIEGGSKTLSEISGSGDFNYQNNEGRIRGAMAVRDGNFIIYALTDPNVSTPVHELVHVFEHYLTDAERKTVLTAAGTPTWTVETSEYFARGFEKYLADGISPSKSLQKIFEQFKEWLTEIYNGVKNSAIDIELSPQMKELYANMLKFVDGEETVSAAEVPLTEEPKAERAKTGQQIDKEVMNTIRESIALDPLHPDYVPVDDQIQDAIQNHISRDNQKPELREPPFLRELHLAFDALSGVAMDASRQIAMGYAIHKLQAIRRDQIDKIKIIQGGFWGNLGFGSALHEARQALSETEDHLEILTRAMVRAGTTLGRALSIRKELLDFNRDTFSSMKQELQDNIRGGFVDQDDEVFIRDLEKKFNDAKAKSQAAADKMAKEQANKAEAIARRQSTQKRNTRGKSLASSLAQLDKIIAGKKC